MPIKRNTLVFSLLALVAIPATVYLAQQQQRVEKNAQEPIVRSINPTPTPEFIPGEVIVKFKEKSKEPQIKASILGTSRDIQKAPVAYNDLDLTNSPTVLSTLQAQFGIRQVEKIFKSSSVQAFAASEGKSSPYLISFEKHIDVLSLVHTLSNSPEIEYAEPNYIVHTSFAPNDPYFLDSYPSNISARDSAWNPQYDYQWDMKAIKMSEAWDLATPSGTQLVAVVDTGIDYTHPELGGCSIDQVRANQCAKVAPGYNVITGSDDPLDDQGHGTHVAGTILAQSDNGVGMAGMDKGSSLRLLPIKALDQDGSGTLADLSAGIVYAAEHGAAVINMSFGNTYPYSDETQTEKDAINQAYDAGVVLVAAAGNANDDVSRGYWPANNPKVIAVAAVDSQYQRAPFSNYGNSVAVAAPGSDILSLRATGTDIYCASGHCNEHVVNSIYYRANGTSMSAPHVAGMAGFIKLYHSQYTNAQIRNIILNSANDLGDNGKDTYYGYGLIDVQKALAQPDATPPIAVSILSPQNEDAIGKGIVEIRGSIESDNLDHYTIEWKKQSDPDTSYTSSGVTLTNSGNLLGRWDASSLAADQYSLRLKAFSQTGKIASFTIHIQLDDSIRAGWPVNPLGDTAFDSVYVSKPVIADLDNDGKKEILYIVDSDLIIYNEKGQELRRWKVSSITGAPPLTRGMLPSVGELDSANGKNEKEIVSMIQSLDSQNQIITQIMAWYADGTPLPGQWPVRVKSVEAFHQLGYAPVITDIDGSGSNEVLYIDYYRYHDAPIQIYLLNRAGTSLIPGVYPKEVANQANELYLMGIPKVADIMGDSAKEIIFRTTDYNLLSPTVVDETYAYDLSGTLLPNFPFHESGRAYTANSFAEGLDVVVEDVNNDGKKDIILPINQYNSAQAQFYPSIKAYTTSKDLLFERPISPAIDHLFATSLDLDGKVDLIASLDNQTAKILSNEGSITGDFVDSQNQHVFNTSPNLSVLDFGTGLRRVLFQYDIFSGKQYAASYDATTKKLSLLPNFPKSPSSQSPFFSSAVDDLDGDGKPELIAGFTVYNLPNTLAAKEWWQYGRDEQHSNTYESGYVPLISPTQAVPTSTAGPTPTLLPNAGKSLETSGEEYLSLSNSLFAGSNDKDFSIEAWIKPLAKDTSTFMQLFSRYNANLQRTYMLLLFTDNAQQKANIRYVFGTGNLQTDYSIPLNLWTHVGVIKDSTTLKIYINGQLVKQAPIGTINDTPGGTNYLGGSLPSNIVQPRPFYKGGIDDLRVSSIARDVTALWNNGAYFQPLPADASTIGLWHFEDVLSDASSTGADWSSSSLNTYGNGRVPGSIIPTITSTPSPTSTPTPIPTNTPTLIPTRTPTTTPTPTTVPSPTPSPTPTPTVLRDTIGIFRPSNAVFYLRNSNTNGVADIVLGYGMRGDIPLVGDWDGDGVQTPGVFRKGTFYLRNSNTSGPADTTVAYGLPADIPVVGDWDGDGKESIGVYRNGLAFLRNTNSIGNADYVFFYGQKGDLPVAGDWDGDGKDTLAVLRSRKFFMRNTNTSGPADRVVSMDKYDGLPVAGDWDRNGKDGVGVFKDGVFTTLNYDLVSPAFVRIWYGQKGDIPLSGVWKK